MTKTAKQILERVYNKGFNDRCQQEKYAGIDNQFVFALPVDQAIKELEAVIEATYDNLPSLDKLTVGNEMSDGYDQGVEAFRQATIKVLYGKDVRNE